MKNFMLSLICDEQTDTARADEPPSFLSSQLEEAETILIRSGICPAWTPLHRSTDQFLRSQTPRTH